MWQKESSTKINTLARAARAFHRANRLFPRDVGSGAESYMGRFIAFCRGLSQTKDGHKCSQCMPCIDRVSIFASLRITVVRFQKINELMQTQILLWHGVAALYYAKRRHKTIIGRNKHHHITVSEHSRLIIVDLRSSALVTKVISHR